MSNEIKLPEPVAYMGTFQIAGCKPGVLAHHTHTNLETLKVSGPQGQSVQPLFTADQLRAAVEADRERIKTGVMALTMSAENCRGDEGVDTARKALAFRIGMLVNGHADLVLNDAGKLFAEQIGIKETP